MKAFMTKNKKSVVKTLPVIKFLRDKKNYVIHRSTATAAAGFTYHVGKYIIPPNSKLLLGTDDEEIKVGIKIVNLYETDDICELTREISTADIVCGRHESIMKIHTIFRVENDQLWVVMPLLSPFSLKTLMSSYFPNGFPLSVVSYVLRKTLEALDCIHTSDNLHKQVGADCLFLENNNNNNNWDVKLAFHSLKHDEWKSGESSSEIIDYIDGSTKEVDVWMFGLLVLELLFGRIPASSFQEFQALMGRIRRDFSGAYLYNTNSKKLLGNLNMRRSNYSFLGSCFNCFADIPKPLGKVLAACLCEDPLKRPSTSQLLEYEFFKNCNTKRGKASLNKLLTKNNIIPNLEV